MRKRIAVLVAAALALWLVAVVRDTFAGPALPAIGAGSQELQVGSGGDEPPAGLVSEPWLAHGAGIRKWWAAHGQTVVEAAGCFLDGAGLGRMLVAGVSGVGGVVVAAGLVVAAVACLT